MDLSPVFEKKERKYIKKEVYFLCFKKPSSWKVICFFAYFSDIGRKNDRILALVDVLVVDEDIL